jgi:sulfur-oxidizing protein SoxX
LGNRRAESQPLARAAVAALLLLPVTPVVAAPVMATPLTATPGDAGRGEKIALDFNRGDCDGCHKLPVPGMPADAFGSIGPGLTGVGSRLTVPELRQRIVDPKAINPATLMPAFYRAAGLTRVAASYSGKTILTAQEVEDVVAYLATLK